MSLFLNAYAHGVVDGPVVPLLSWMHTSSFHLIILACLLLARLENGGGSSTNEVLEGFPHLKVTNGLRFLQ
jgi:hypothetical protein